MIYLSILLVQKQQYGRMIFIDIFQDIIQRLTYTIKQLMQNAQQSLLQALAHKKKHSCNHHFTYIYKRNHFITNIRGLSCKQHITPTQRSLSNQLEHRNLHPNSTHQNNIQHQYLHSNIKESPQKMPKQSSAEKKRSQNYIMSFERDNNFMRIKNIKTEKNSGSKQSRIKGQQRQSSKKDRNSNRLLRFASNSINNSVNNISNNGLQSYVSFINGDIDQSFKIKCNFSVYRLKDRRYGLRWQEKGIFNRLSKTFSGIYENLCSISSSSWKHIQQYCCQFFNCYQKIQVEVHIQMYYPAQLQHKIDKLYIYERYTLYLMYFLTLQPNALMRSELQSIKFLILLLIECQKCVMEPIRCQQSSVVTKMSQAFQLLKAISEVQKRILMIERELHRINIENRIPPQIVNRFKEINRHYQNIEQVVQLEMELSWKYLKIPPVPFLPHNNQEKPFTLIIELNSLLIFYDNTSKMLKYRPFLDIFLRNLQSHFQIVIFCMRDHKFTSTIVKQVEKKVRFISYELCQQHLCQFKGRMVKDMNRIGRNMAKTIVIDTTLQNYLQIPRNKLLVKSWFGDKSDSQLFIVMKMLLQMIENNPQDISLFLNKKSLQVEAQVLKTEMERLATQQEAQ